MPRFAPFCKGFGHLTVNHTISDNVENYAK